MDVVIAGYGTAGGLHAALLSDRPGIRITGVVDYTAARRDAASARYPSAAVASRLDDLDAHADMVVVCTPPAHHGADTRTALTRQRAHVLCEKPAVLDPNDGRDLARIAADAGLLLHPVHNYLHSPAVHELRAIATRATASVTHVVIDVIRPGPAHGQRAWRPKWRTEPGLGGGILYDHGPHACYLACHLTGQPVISVSCATKPGEHGADHAAQLRLRFQGGTTATITLSWNGTTRTNSYELHGARCSVRMRNGHLDLTTPAHTISWATEDHSLGGHTHETWTKSVHQTFLDQVTNSSHVHNPWDAAVHVADILHAAHVSASTGQRAVDIGLAHCPTGDLN